MLLKAKKRTITGRKVKNLRKERILPAVVYGEGLPAIPISLDLSTFKKIYQSVGEAELLNLIIDKEKPIKVLIKDLQYDPLTDEVTHVDLHKVELTKKVTAAVPIEVTGESPAVRSGEGVLLTLLDEIEIEAFPLDLPKKVTVDISHLLKVGEGIKVEELPVDRSKIKVKHEEESLVLKIDYPEMLEEEEEKEITPKEVEVTEEKEEEVGEEEKVEEEEEAKDKPEKKE